MNLKLFKLNGYFFFIFLLTILFITITFFILNNITSDKRLLTKLENSLIITKDLLEEQKRYAQSLSILLSEDKELIQAYTKNNREATYNIVNQKIRTLKKLQNISFEVQIHDQDLKTFIRSWDLNIKDIHLSSFRHGLVQVKKSLKPLSSIELGKRLNIKAISPIIKDNTFIGSIEVIMSFNELTKELNEKGLDFFVLLNNKYLNIATALKNNPKITNYTLVNQNKNYEYLNDIHSFEDYGYFTNHSLAYIYFSYYSLKREKLGYIIVSIKNPSQINIKKSYQKKIIINGKDRIIIE